jgi:hypothetical protein
MSVLTHNLPYKYNSSMVIYNKLYELMTGEIKIQNSSKGNKIKNNNHILAIDLEKSGVVQDNNGNIQLTKQNDLVMAYSDGKQWHYSRGYAATQSKSNLDCILLWTESGFANFITELLSKLEGKDLNNVEAPRFGKVFNRLN